MREYTISRREIVALGMMTLGTASCGGGGTAAPDPQPPSPSPAPSPAPAPPAPAPSPPAGLTVVGGVQAASRTLGARSDVFADADPAGQVFDHWTGAAALLQSPGERRSGSLPPSAASTVTATYRPLPNFTPQTAVINGLSASDPLAVNGYWQFPATATRGLVFRFHGKGGNGATQFSKTEELKFARDALAAGFGVASIDSNDRVERGWDTATPLSQPSTNLDVANVLQLIGRLSTLGLVNAATPLFASGHSAGAGFALRIAFLLGWKASHQSCVPGTLAIAQATPVPGIWTMAQNDTREEPTRNADALTASNALAARGVVTDYTVVAPSAVYPSRFNQTPGVGVDDSNRFYSALKTAGLLDADDYQVTDPNDVNLAPLLPASLTVYAKDIADQLNVAYTAHQFSAATSRRVLDFLAARL